MQVSSCVYSTEENGRAIKDQICLSQSLMRVEIEIDPQPEWGTKRAINASHGIFMHYFRFSKKCCVDLCFMSNPWTNYRLLLF